jgi:hypothetical protein
VQLLPQLPRADLERHDENKHPQERVAASVGGAGDHHDAEERDEEEDGCDVHDLRDLRLVLGTFLR